jgi:hypothetical protein
MLGTYASFLLVLGLSALVGQAVFAACGRRTWSWLSPAIGLAPLIAVAWGTVRLPGEGLAALIAVAALGCIALVILRPGVWDVAAELRFGLPVAAVALLAASLPFIVEARFGILGTGLNPDMSQHLFAADRLASGGSERLISEGYPLGPHALVVALAELGPSTVHAFDGLTLAIAVAACLAPLGLLRERATWERVAVAFVVGLAYLVASSHVQGAFKETMQALFVLAFAIGLHELARGTLVPAQAARLRAAIPLAVIAIGSVYAYSFPGLAWLAGAALLWAAIELALVARRTSLDRAWRVLRGTFVTVGVAAGVLLVAIAPEVSRVASFADFETFNPDGAGLGNLFNRLSPLEALGIWPSGDFRVEPGDGEVPAVVFYLGAALGLAALGLGLHWSLRRGEFAIPAALGAAAVLWLYSLVDGTPYQEAKALVLMAPLVALVAARGLVALAAERRGVAALAVPLTGLYLIVAGGSSLLALANGPVGPSDYSPALAELRPKLGGEEASTLVLAPPELLEDEHGRDYLVWELRGNRICVEEQGLQTSEWPEGISTFIRIGEGDAVEPKAIGGFDAPDPGPGTCPFIPDGARADPAGDG